MPPSTFKLRELGSLLGPDQPLAREVGVKRFTLLARGGEEGGFSNRGPLGSIPLKLAP